MSTPCPQFELEVVLVYAVENEPKFYGLFSGKRAVMNSRARSQEQGRNKSKSSNAIRLKTSMSRR